MEEVDKNWTTGSLKFRASLILPSVFPVFKSNNITNDKVILILTISN
jgi:hypothetical protein